MRTGATPTSETSMFAGAFSASTSTRCRLYHVTWRGAGVRAGKRFQELGSIGKKLWVARRSSSSGFWPISNEVWVKIKDLGDDIHKLYRCVWFGLCFPESKWLRGGKSAIFWLGNQTDHGGLSWGFTPQLMAISLNGKNDDKASQILGYHVLGYSQIPSLHRNFSLWLYAPTNLGRNTLAALEISSWLQLIDSNLSNPIVLSSQDSICMRYQSDTYTGNSKPSFHCLVSRSTVYLASSLLVYEVSGCLCVMSDRHWIQSAISASVISPSNYP